MNKKSAGLSGGAIAWFLCFAIRALAKTWTIGQSVPTPGFSPNEAWVQCEATAVETLISASDLWVSTVDASNPCLVIPELRRNLLGGQREHWACSPPTDRRLVESSEGLDCTFFSWLEACSALEAYCASPDEEVLDAAMDDYSKGSLCGLQAAQLLQDYIDKPLGD